MAPVNGGFLHYTNMKKFLKKSSDEKPLVKFEIISQESGFDTSRLTDCPI